MIGCEAAAPDGKSRCGYPADHVGVHENWYGTWFGSVWFMRWCDVMAGHAER